MKQLQQLPTLPKPPEKEPRRIQVFISDDAYRRIYAAAGRAVVSPGRIVEQLADGLPAVESAA